MIGFKIDPSDLGTRERCDSCLEYLSEQLSPKTDANRRNPAIKNLDKELALRTEPRMDFVLIGVGCSAKSDEATEPGKRRRRSFLGWSPVLKLHAGGAQWVLEIPERNEPLSLND